MTWRDGGYTTEPILPHVHEARCPACGDLIDHYSSEWGVKQAIERHRRRKHPRWSEDPANREQLAAVRQAQDKVRDFLDAMPAADLDRAITAMPEGLDRQQLETAAGAVSVGREALLLAENLIGGVVDITEVDDEEEAFG